MSINTISLLDAIKQRSSLHALTSDISISDERVQEIVKEAILHAPTPFNCQSGRVVILLKDEHKRFWDTAHDVAKASVAPPVFEKAYEPRIKLFLAAHGTILFYESQDALDKASNPIVKAQMPQWSEHATGMLQYIVWTMLCSEGLGVNLQHYSPMVDVATAKQWNIPADWSLKAQMVFGGPTGGRLREKKFEPVEERLKVIGA